MTKWPMIPLDDVLQLDLSPVAVHAADTYPIVGILGFGRGLFTREAVTGGSISASQLFRVKANQFIYSRLKAFEGAFGIVPPELDGRFVSNEFPTFSCDPKRLEPTFLGWYFRNPSTWTAAARSSTGIGARRERLKPERLLKMTIPLPPLKEQQRLVEYLDALSVKIDEAKLLRIDADTERSLLFSRAAAGLFSAKQWQEIPLAGLLAEDSRNGLGIRPNNSPPGVPILRISAGTSRDDAIVDERDTKYLEISAKELDAYRLRKGDLLACRFNGNLHYVGRFSLFRQELPDDRVYPDKLIRFRVDQTVVLPEFVRYAMNSPAGRSKIEAFCTTTAGNIGISAKELKTIPVPLPTLDEQRQIVNRLDQVQQLLAQHYVEAEPIKQEIDAMRSALLAKAFNGEAA